MIRDLISKNRSYRRFAQSPRLTEQDLVKLIELARFSPSGANLQPLKFAYSFQDDLNAQIYPQLAWAGYLTDWAGPEPDERPTAYIVILHDTNISKSPGCDHGIAAQSILLGAVEKGFAGCMLGSVNRPRLAEALQLPSHLEISLVIALGSPAEKITLEDADDSIKYYRDDQQTHHVPKRTLDELIVKK